MKISVVIPTHKRPELLVRCIEALKGQIFPKDSFEVIVVTDGPDEKTLIAAKSLMRHDFLLRIYSLPSESGPAAARNFGWRAAQSKLIAFTDDDCIPDKKWLLNIWNAFLQATVSKVAFTGRTLVPIPKVPTDHQLNLASLERSEFVTANCTCTKAALEMVGGFDEAFKMDWREDRVLQFKLIQANVPIIPVKTAIVTHPVRKAPWGISIKDEQKGMFNALLYKKYPQLYRNKIQPNMPWRYYIISFFFILCMLALLLNLRDAALFFFGPWMVFTIWFCIQRLSKTSKRFSHVLEMFITSALIPLFSVFYRVYGAWKFKSPFLH